MAIGKMVAELKVAGFSRHWPTLEMECGATVKREAPGSLRLGSPMQPLTVAKPFLFNSIHHQCSTHEKAIQFQICISPSARPGWAVHNFAGRLAGALCDESA